jgi:GNAT superfamily N-acetyltransferase
MTINGTNGANMANGASQLPVSSSPDIILDRPTDEEALAQLKKNAVAWKGALSFEAYLQREEHLANQQATKGGGITYWVLVDSKDRTNRHVLAGCETYKKRAFIARNGKVEEGIVHGIGSVFAPPEYRGKGYAGRMMKEIGRELEMSKENERHPFSVLFSDIGKVGLMSMHEERVVTSNLQKFYANHGWQPYPASHISLPGSKSSPATALPEARPLYDADLPDLCATDEQLIKKSLTEVAASSDKTLFALIPDLPNIRWHHAREEFVGLQLHGKVPEIKGAIVGTEPGKRIWCYWTRVWYNPDPSIAKANTLHILRLVVEEKEIVDWEKTTLSTEEREKYGPSIAALLAMAQREAYTWKTEQVEVWNPNAVAVDAAKLLLPSAEIIHREDESIPSLRWHFNSDGSDGEEEITWLGNEKYGWC